MAKKTTAGDDRMVAVEEALGKTEQFIEKNQNMLIYIVLGILIVVLGYFGYKKFYIGPMEDNAQEQIFMAQKYFEMDSLNRALNGDGNALGFLDIIDDYGRTNTGNLAKYYAGVCYLKMGNFEEAVEYLEQHDPTDQIIGPMALGALGDAYLELNDPEQAVRYYLEAADVDVNDFTTPLFLYKAGMTYEMQEEYQDAYDVYERIYLEYYRAPEARNIERNMARIKRILETE